MEVMRWVLVGIIGLCTGIVAAFIDICVKELFKAKFSVFEMGNLLSVHAAYSSLYNAAILLSCDLMQRSRPPLTMALWYSRS